MRHHSPEAAIKSGYPTSKVVSTFTTGSPQGRGRPVFLEELDFDREKRDIRGRPEQADEIGRQPERIMTWKTTADAAQRARTPWMV